ncbi:MAG: right-handed parallel beta-helix repeat-containing protein [Terriglobia bacterium]
MNRLRITLSNRRRFVFSAAMAVVFVLLAGIANAQVLTVRCVPSHTISSSCSATDYTSIQNAVTAAASGDIILVGPGTYKEYVTIGTDSLSLFGAQAGRDAREDRDDPKKESIVNATGTGYPTITISAPFVVVDGFTIQGGTGGTPFSAGILLQGSQGMQIINNIIQANSSGVFLNGSSSNVIEHNLIKNNNGGTGLVVGCGVEVLGGPFLSISDNEFAGNHAAAISILGGVFTTITNNTSENDGSFAVFLGTSGNLFSHNRGRKFGAQGALPVFCDGVCSVDADAAVDIGGGNEFLEISHNDLEEGEGSIRHGIAFTTVFGSSSDSEGVIVKDNTIKRFKDNGIVAETDTTVSPTAGMTRYSSIVANDVEDNGQDGIFIEGAGVYNSNISLFDNEAEGNHVFDCQDTSLATGPGYTLGTHNTWFNNIGNLSYPKGLCTPGRGHDH